MKNTALINNLNQIAIEDNSWQADVAYYDANKNWLDLSAQIAIKVVRKLRRNKNESISPNTQKELAELMQVSPQQINKLLQGKENLTLETITRLEKALSISLISINSNTYEIQTKNVSFATTYIDFKDYAVVEKSMKTTEIAFCQSKLAINLAETNKELAKSYAMGA